jgi:hypothetical protein
MAQIYFGEHHEAGLDFAGNIYVWKKHVLFSSKSKDINDNERENVTKLTKEGGFLSVNFTKGFMWALHKSGKVV